MNSTFTFELCNHLDERYRRGKSYLPVEISDQVRKNLLTSFAVISSVSRLTKRS